MTIFQPSPRFTKIRITQVLGLGGIRTLETVLYDHIAEVEHVHGNDGFARICAMFAVEFTLLCQFGNMLKL